MKPDEASLLRSLQCRPKFAPVIPLIEALDIPSKRAVYILEKWAKKDWYDYGVNVLRGWLTPEGRTVTPPAQRHIYS